FAFELPFSRQQDDAELVLFRITIPRGNAHVMGPVHRQGDRVALEDPIAGGKGVENGSALGALKPPAASAVARVSWILGDDDHAVARFSAETPEILVVVVEQVAAARADADAGVFAGNGIGHEKFFRLAEEE